MSRTKPSARRRLADILFLSIFALAFGGFGLAIGVWPLWHMASESSQLDRYVPVPADILEVRLAHDSDNGAWLLARYRYQYAGRSLESDRVALSLNHPSMMAWHERLVALHTQKQPVTAWIDPRHPGRALLDKQIPWGSMAFLLPFATLFPLVGLGSLWALWQRGQPKRPQQPRPATIRSNALQQVLLMGGFAFIWSLIAFPLAIAAWSEHSMLSGIGLFVGLFPALGLVLMVCAVYMGWQAYRHRGATLIIPTEGLHAGEAATVVLTLPAHRLLRDGGRAWRLTLNQTRLRNNDSDNHVEPIWLATLAAEVTLMPDGMGRVRATLSWPLQAPPSGIDAGGHLIGWHLTLIEGKDKHSQDFPLHVAPGRAGLIQRAPGMANHRLDGSHPDRPEPVPSQWMHITKEGPTWRADFPVTGHRILAGLFTALAVVLTWLARSQSDSVKQADAWLSLLLNAVACGLILLALLAWTKRHAIIVQGEQWWLDRSSNLRNTRRLLPPRHQVTLLAQHAYTSSSPTKGSTFHHKVIMRHAHMGHQSLTPALPGKAMALGVIQLIEAAPDIAQAWIAASSSQAHGKSHRPAPPSSAPFRRDKAHAWLAFGLCSLISLAIGARLDEHVQAHQTPVIGHALHQRWQALSGAAERDDALLEALDADDDNRLLNALRRGANPNAIGVRGSSALMLAATQGKLTTVDLLLRHGADVQFVNVLSVNERGDTALLRTAYFGHAEVFDRLIQAGARTDITNRWGWTPVHMAAMGGCLPCLTTLKTTGLSLDAKASASRGESPLMLAAAKGQVAAMAWLLEHGADSHQQDAHGQTAIDWARFAHQTDAEQWLKEHIGGTP